MRGIGIDTVEIDRVKRAIERHGEHFLTRIYTPYEIAYCTGPDGKLRFPSLAARFAAKEAFYKAAFPVFRQFIGWHECEVTNDADGVPSLRLSPRIREALGEAHVHVSLSHSRSHAVALVLIE